MEEENQNGKSSKEEEKKKEIKPGSEGYSVPDICRKCNKHPCQCKKEESK